jgi:prolyl oligopeptidase
MHALVIAAVLAAPALVPPPAALVRPVTDTHHGVAVTDPYRWLEKADDAEVKAWTEAQDRRTRDHLAAYPAMGALRARVKEMMLGAAGQYGGIERRGAAWFAVKYQPPRQQVFLVTLASLDDLASEKVLLDPVALDPSGGTAIDFFQPSPDGKLVAVSLSERGTESGTVRVLEVATGKDLPDRIPRVNGGTAGGSLAWAAGNKGFWYTRYPAAGERPEADLPFFQEVWFHRLGAPVGADLYELGREFDAPRIAEHFLQASEDGRHVLDLVQKGDGREFALYLRREKGGWRKVAGLADKVVGARFGLDGGLWLFSLKEAPRGRILRVALASPDLAKAKVVAAAGEGAIDSFAVTASRLYVDEIAGGPSVIRAFALDGKPLGTLPTEPVAAAEGLRRTGPVEVVYSSTSYVAPRAWYRVSGGGAPARLAVSSRSPVDFSDVEVIRETATSKDGTKVPLTVLQRRGRPRDGLGPALLYGFGDYGVSEKPTFSTTRRILLDHGFAVALANIRGGGEWGEAWHLAGNLTHKQNVFDDFAACGRLLAEKSYTSPERLSLLGGSNGGLLMGAMIAQQPGLARAVVAAVGIFDMVRVEETPNGAFNVTEFGTVKDKAQFEALYAYSPYHRVADGTAYPAVLLTAGANDPRVDAWHAKKMAARLQAATSSGRPVLLRVSGFGHGMGTPLDERIAEIADIDAFLFMQLGVPPQGAAADPRGR